LKTAPRPAKPAGITELRARLAESDETLRAIRAGEVDAVVGTGTGGLQVFTLPGADHGYRALIESMNEGALMLTRDKTILYANSYFARLVKFPLQQVIGSSFRRFLSARDRASLQAVINRADRAGAKVQVQLKARDGALIAVQISLRPLAADGAESSTIGMVVTDMTEARRSEEMLRALAHRVVQAQEAERGRVAFELHDHITQLLCALQFRSQSLVAMLARQGGRPATEAAALRAQLGAAADEVERISRHLRPGVLEHLGLVAAVRAACTEFSNRTNVPVRLTWVDLTGRLSEDSELTLYRILQEGLKNVERHARAGRVIVRLAQPRGFVRLTIRDNGVGFNLQAGGRRGKDRGGLGLLGMRERANSVGGVLKMQSRRGAGTAIEALIPVEPVSPPAKQDVPVNRVRRTRP